MPLNDEAYDRETNQVVATRLPGLVGAFAIIFGVAWVMEYLTHPERMALYAVTFALELLTCGAALALTRRSTTVAHSVVIVATASSTVCLLTAQYYAWAGADAEILALALSYLITGVTVFVPLGGWGQLPVAATAVVGYCAAVMLGANVATGSALPVLGLVSIGGLSVAGAALVERYRRTSFLRTDELRRANTALAQANEAKNLFLANVSHELRSPLNVILGYGQLILDGTFGPVPAPAQEPLERMVASGHSLVALINDLLDLSRIEAGRLTMRSERVELARLFAELTGFVAPALANKSVRFAIDDPGAAAVTADPDRLRQVLVNLLSNATKFTVRGEIRLSAVVDGEPLTRLIVADTGVGIAAEDIGHIFEPFHRAANAKEFGGVGIGLSISARLVRAMGGQIEVESSPHGGTRFTVSVPAA